MPSAADRLDAVLNDRVLAAALAPRVRSLRALEVKACHEALKAAGVKTMGLRQKVVVVLSECTEAELGGEELRSRLVSAGLQQFEAVCERASQLMAETDARALQAALKQAGVSTLGHRQKVANIIRALQEGHAPPASTDTHRVSGSTQLGAATSESDDALQLEENDADGELLLEDNDDAELQLEDNDDGSIQLEDNDDDDGLQLEDNDGIQLEENDDNRLQLKDNEGRLQDTAAGTDMELDLIEPPTMPEVAVITERVRLASHWTAPAPFAEPRKPDRPDAHARLLPSHLARLLPPHLAPSLHVGPGQGPRRCREGGGD